MKSKQFRINQLSDNPPRIYSFLRIQDYCLNIHSDMNANAKGITLPDDIVNELANTKYRGVRELKNNINRIIALQELSVDNQF